MQRFARANGVMAVVNVLLGTGDLGAVVKDLGSSNAIDVWTVEAVRPRAHLRVNGQLNPTTTTVDPGHLDSPSQAFVTLVASLPATGPLAAIREQGSALTYRWTVAGDAGGLLLALDAAGNLQQGTQLETTSPSVRYQTGGSISPYRPQDGQSDTVSVEIYLLTPSSGAGPGVKQKAGERSTAIRMQRTQVTISPAEATIAAGDAQRLQVTTTAPAEDSLLYVWRTGGGYYSSHGELSIGSEAGTWIETESASVTYTASASLGSLEIDTVTVDAYRIDYQGDRHYLGEAEATLTLRPQACGALPDSIFTWCNPGTTVSPRAARPGETVTISWTQGSGALCGGASSVSVWGVPGTFTSHAGGTLQWRTVTFPGLACDPCSQARSVTFKLSDVLADYVGVDQCPGPSRCYLCTGSGPWVEIDHGGTDLIPFSISL
jgi:hypothetical protein